MTNVEPYVGPRPFERIDEAFFFGREKEANELLSLIIANPVLLLYARSGAGKTSLLNARLTPMLEKEEIEILPIARVQGRIPANINLSETPNANAYVFSALMSWKKQEDDPKILVKTTLAEFLGRTKRPASGEDESARPRVVIFDQFEELFTFYPDRWRDRLEFFRQVSDLLDGSPLLVRASDLQDFAGLAEDLKAGGNVFFRKLWQQLSPDAQQVVEKRDGAMGAPDTAAKVLVDELNRFIQGGSLYDETSFVQAELRDETRELIRQGPSDRDIPKLNRLLLEDAFPQRIRRRAKGDPLLRVVFSMREDYIAELDPYVSVLPNRMRARYRLEPLREKTALAAIKGPLEKTNLHFGKGVAEHLVENLLKVPMRTGTGATEIMGEFVEPVQLQVVCQTLWEKVQSTGATEITEEHLRTYGNVDKALRAFYERAIQKVIQAKDVKEWSLRRWFEDVLITTAGTRGTVFRGAATTGGLLNGVVDELESQHIIRAELRGGERWYELSHDRFIQPIRESNNEWRLQRSGAMQKRKELEERAAEWARTGRGESGLLDESAAVEAKRWLDSTEATEVGYSDDLFAFVQSSRLAVAKAASERDRAIYQREKAQAEAIAKEQKQRAEAERLRAEEQQQRAEEQTRRAESERLRAEDKARFSRRLLWASGILILLLISTAVAGVSALRNANRATEQSQIAGAERTKALQAADEAKKAREFAEQQEDHAEKQREIAEDEKQKALMAKEEAEKQRIIAVKNGEEAKKQSQIAITEKKKAEAAAAAERAAREQAVAATLAERVAKEEAVKANEAARNELRDKNAALEQSKQELNRAEAKNLETDRVNADLQAAKQKYEAQTASLQQALKDLESKCSASAGMTGNADEYFRRALDFELKGNWQAATDSYNKAIGLYIPLKDATGIARASTKLGDIYLGRKDFSKASNAYQNALKQYQSAGNKKGVAAIYYKLGYLSLTKSNETGAQEDKDDALKNFNLASDAFDKLDDDDAQAATLDAIGDTYQAIGDFGEAKDAYEKALTLYQKLQNKPATGQMYFNIGYAYLRKGDTSKALKNLEDSLKVRQEISDITGQISTLNQMGDVYRQLGDTKSATESFQRAQQLQRTPLKGKPTP
jgi:tetratricopeptide (TPR) repeat protein/cytochrome c-type biogenesis protein CcmH/NrfF